MHNKHFSREYFVLVTYLFYIKCETFFENNHKLFLNTKK